MELERSARFSCNCSEYSGEYRTSSRIPQLKLLQFFLDHTREDAERIICERVTGADFIQSLHFSVESYNVDETLAAISRSTQRG